MLETFQRGRGTAKMMVVTTCLSTENESFLGRYRFVIRVRLMTAADVALGMRLKTQANWNQVEADWQRFLALEPDGCFVAELDGVPVGTTTTCIFGDIAWIAAVLVDESLRGKGIGRALMEHALAFLDGRGIRSVRLDATPMGRPLYEKLGFVLEYELARFDGELAVQAAPPDPAVTPVSGPEWYEQIFQLDQAVTATNRAKLLGRFFAEQPAELRVFRREGKVTGYLTTRAGSKAHFIGPCIASAEAGRGLLADAFRRYTGKKVFVDIPLGNLPAVRLAEAHGLKGQRPLYRMGRGPIVEEKFLLLWASSGPEKG